MRAFLAAVACTMVGTTALATVACSVVPEVGAEAVPMYSAPEMTSDIVRAVPIGDLVLYPQAELAPEQAVGWAWVRHDPTQDDIWQSGDYGWIPEEQLDLCG